jgi:Sec-independent protein secretion pathway component TatC
MKGKMFVRFSRVTVVLWILAIVIAAIVAPPDPITQLVYAFPLLLLGPVVSYVLTYRGGLEYLKSKV